MNTPTWFYSDGQQTYGPVNRDQLIVMIQSGQLVAAHYVMAAGASEWTAIGSSPFAGYLPQAAPVQMPAQPRSAPPQRVTPARPGPPVRKSLQPQPVSAQRAPAPVKKKSPWVAIAAVLALAAAGGGYFWHQSNAAKALPSATKESPFINSLGMKFIPVPGTDVLMCVHETRNQDFELFAAENPNVQNFWSHRGMSTAEWEQEQEHTVWSMSWFDAQAFCDWLSKKEGRFYRLPTNTEWCLAAGIPTDPKATPAVNRDEYPADSKGYSTTKPNYRGFKQMAGGTEWLSERMPDKPYMALRHTNRFFEQDGNGTNVHGGTFRCVLAASSEPPAKSLPPSRMEGIVTYKPAGLNVVDQGFDGWLLTDGKVQLQLFDTQADANLALAMAIEHTERHIIAYGDTIYSFEYWTGNSGLRGGAKTSNVLSYKPEDLFIEQVKSPEYDGLKVWAICRHVNGSLEVLKHLDSEGHAKAALEIAKKCTRRCVIRPNSGIRRPMPHDSYEMIYWE